MLVQLERYFRNVYLTPVLSISIFTISSFCFRTGRRE